MIQSLGARRGELDQREQGLSTELALIQAAEAKVDARIATMNGLKADMTRRWWANLLDDKQQAEVDRLVKVFEAMINNKPQDAADRFKVLLSDEARLPIAAKMKEQLLSAMIATVMTPPEAKRLTESLAARYAAQASAARAAINPPAAPAIAAASAKPPPAAKTAQATQSAPDQLQPVADAEPAPKAKPAVHRKPKVAKTPPKTVAAAKPGAKTCGRGQAAGAGRAAQAGGSALRLRRRSRQPRAPAPAPKSAAATSYADRDQDGGRHASGQAGCAARRAARQARQLRPRPRRRPPGRRRRPASACLRPSLPARRRRRDRGAGDRRQPAAARRSQLRRPRRPR